MLSTFYEKIIKIALSFSICLLPIFLTGCWDRKEINDLALVLATSIDRSESGEIELSVQLAIPNAMGGGQSSGGGGSQGGGTETTTVKVAKGKTVFDAMSKLQANVSRRIFWGHNRVIIFGKELAKEGIRQHTDFFARHPEPRLRSYVFVSKGKAADIFEVTPKFDDHSGEAMKELARFRVGMSVTLKELLQMLSGNAGSAALPIIEAATTGSDKGVRVDGTAIFKKDKMVGEINEELTRGLLWLRDEIDLAAVVLEPEEDGNQIAFNLLRSRTRLVPKIEKDKWKVLVKVTTEDDAVENETKLNLMDQQVVRKLQKQMEEKIAHRIQETLNQVQKEMKSDVFGFADTFHRAYPKQWKEDKGRWDEIFPEVEVEIKVKAYIRRPGMSTTPQGLPEKEVQDE